MRKLLATTMSPRSNLVIALALVIILAVTVALAAVPSTAHAQTGCVAYHTVQFGENLYRIGLRYGVPYTTLAVVNGITNPHRIFTGQMLCIPAAVGTTWGTTYTAPPTTTTTTYIPGTLNYPANWHIIVNLPYYYPIVEPPGGDPGHQLNFWPEYGGRWTSDSIRLEPPIQIWTPCEPQAVIYEQLLACSKTGLGWFYDFNMIDPNAVPAP